MLQVRGPCHADHTTAMLVLIHDAAGAGTSLSIDGRCRHLRIAGPADAAPSLTAAPLRAHSCSALQMLHPDAAVRAQIAAKAAAAKATSVISGVEAKAEPDEVEIEIEG